MAGHRLVFVAPGAFRVSVRVLAFDDPAGLPDDARALLDAAERTEFQLGAVWFGAVAAAAVPPGARPWLLLCRDGARALALLPLLRLADGTVTGLTAPYTCAFRPLAATDATAEDLRRAGRAFGRAVRRHGKLRLDALDNDWPGWPPLLAGLRQAGLVALHFAHFANWHTTVAGLGWPDYLAARPGRLRETVRRRQARAARDPAVTFEMATGGAALSPAMAAYEEVYARSWKPPEPYPAFNACFLQAAAASGVLRLSVLRQGGVPLAAQYWTVCAGTATVLKLAHDESARALSPGTVLTALTIQYLLDHDRIARLDFGRGDDAYKSDWTGERRLRGGVLLCPWWQASGLAQIARHRLGRYRRRTNLPDGEVRQTQREN